MNRSKEKKVSTASKEHVSHAKDTSEEVNKRFAVEQKTSSTFMIDQYEYQLVKNHREAFNLEKLEERFSDILFKYDYIVGDWGYEQLRLKGFFSDTNKKAVPFQKIGTLEDYLYEYCNFGCAYFVIERITQPKYEKKSTKPKVKKNQAFISEKTQPIKEVKKSKPIIKNRGKKNEPTDKQRQKSGNSTFVIRQRKD